MSARSSDGDTTSLQPDGQLAATGPIAGSVCVLVRSMDRPGLPKAVASALKQAGVAVRVVVVAAHGAVLSRIGGLRDHPDVHVDESGLPLSRALAANRCLELAHGDTALFLDDDDWLEPGHLHRLAAELAAHPEAVAAHTGVVCMGGDPAAPRRVHVFDAPIDPVGMQLQNQLPIHSVLFRTTVLRGPQALRFDSGLDHFEDWDFWLRMMQLGDFVHVPGISAVYWLDEQSGSGHATQAQARFERLAQLGRRQLARWSGEDVARLIERDVRRTQALEDGEQQLRARQADIAALDGQLRAAVVEGDEWRLALEHVQRHAGALEDDLAAHRAEVARLAMARQELLSQVSVLDARVRALLQSTSWRVTRPLRAVAAAARWVRSGRARSASVEMMRLAMAAWRRHGLLGVGRRLPTYVRQVPRYLRELGHRAPGPQSNPFARSGRHTGSVRLHPEITGVSEPISATVSIVIPTYNAGVEFGWLMRKLRDQQGIGALEIVVVDSGSSDDTVELAREAGAVLVQITQQEFSHSHARNLGARHASGDYLLFMVQDAYPIGRLWVYGMLDFLRQHAEAGVVAASCAEVSRSDSDAMYDCMIDTHYRFLGCRDVDRIGHHTGDDHTSLRTMGQLSDVACLIPRELFLRYGYRGDYAEDLDLGIRLIRDGHRIAMLASVKVIHSHLRPPWYYLKRSFVDVVFLVGLFDDFHMPASPSLGGLLAGMRAAAHLLHGWLAQIEPAMAAQAPADALRRWIEGARRVAGSAAGPVGQGDWDTIGDDRVDAFLRGLVPPAATAGDAAGAATSARLAHRQFIDDFLARVDHFRVFAEAVYPLADARVRDEVAQALRKTYCASAGAALAYFVLDRRQAGRDEQERGWAESVFDLLKAGV